MFTAYSTACGVAGGADGIILSMFLQQIGISLLFLTANIAILLSILAAHRPSGGKRAKEDSPATSISTPKVLNASDILSAEFEYARTTASEAMQDRHTMINFYLLIVGIIGSGVVAVFASENDLANPVGTILLWLLCGVGWLYFLKLIRLRQAWNDSALAMAQIKDFYIQHSQSFDQQTLRTAFRWQLRTLPPPNKPWTLFFYSAALIAYLDTAAFVGGGTLLNLSAAMSSPLLVFGTLSVLGLAFFCFHIYLYFAFLSR